MKNDIVETGRVIRKLRDLRLRKSEALDRGLLKAGLQLQADAQKLVPIDTGRLKASAKTQVENSEVTVSFNTPYALVVHERLDVYHPVGQAKYLEEPARKNRKKYMNTIKREIKAARP